MQARESRLSGGFFSDCSDFEFALNAVPDLVAGLFGDRIEQLTCYLLTNAAARGTAQGPVSLIVHAENTDLVIEVWCDGEPIPKSQLRDLFAPGWSRAGVDGQDLGLGLHICALIVAAHGGKISATSSKSLGTQIVARIPLAAR